MEDSGIDSGDRVANFMNYNKSNNDNNIESENSSNEDVLNTQSRSSTSNITSNCDNIDELVFLNPSLINPASSAIRMSTIDSPMSSQVPTIESATTKKSSSFHQQLHLNEHNKKLSKINTCKGLQRKLEQKVERAKKNFLQNEKLNQLENDIDFKKPSLIPINRLPFPRNESQRLVEYKSDNSDDEEGTTFFPVQQKRKFRRKNPRRKEELDTFSIHEMTIIESDSNDGDKSSEDDDEDCDTHSLDLELPRSRTNDSIFNKVKSAFCCSRRSEGMF